MSHAEQIYLVYPRKIAKRAALASIEKALRRLEYGESGQPMPRTEAAARLFCTVVQYSKTPAGMAGSFTPHPTTWFNQSRYLDDQKEWYRNENTDKESSLRRGNTDALAKVFGNLPTQDRTAVLEDSLARSNRNLGGRTGNLFLKGD